MMSREKLLDLLRNNVVEVVFTKADGTERRMVCTLREEMIPAEDAPKGSGKAVNEAIIPVYDVDNVGWRSFRVDSVKKVTLI